MRAVEKDPAAERLYAVFEADEAGATAEAGAAPTVVPDADAQDVVVDSTVIVTAEACACLVTLVSASATT